MAQISQDGIAERSDQPPCPGATMPVTYAIDPERRLVLSQISDPATENEVHEHNRRLRTDPLFDPSYQQLADMTGVTEILVSTVTVRETALDSFFAPGVRRAFVATS